MGKVLKVVKKPTAGSKKTFKVKKAKRVQVAVSGSDGFFSGKFPPRDSIIGRRIAAKALKTGHLVLEIQGHFLAVPLKQGLRYKQKTGGSGFEKRYTGYQESKNVAEALKNGAVPDDFYYDLKHGNLEFVPKLIAKQAKGPLPRSEWPPGVREDDAPRPFWLPHDWAHGVKTTCKTHLRTYIAPSGRLYYHRETIEKIVQQQLGGLEGYIAHAKKQLQAGLDWSGQPVKFSPDAKLFECLSAREKKALPKSEEFFFAIVSARRANKTTGVRGIAQVQARFKAAGVEPRWYVDAESLQDYRNLGLDAVVGGKLCPARNKALADAKKMGKVCVQVSDDISSWQFIKSGPGALRVAGGPASSMKAANAALKTVEKLILSPLTAARFLVAKMRAARGQSERGDGPYLAGVFPTANAALSIMTDDHATEVFILGDFFVHDIGSPVRFDESMTLKEDYDFTCQHLQRHGCVYRCNRMVVHACHETNAGGACSVRDAKGERERQNVHHLQTKWPGVFKANSRRGDTQVIMKYFRKSTAGETDTRKMKK